MARLWTTDAAFRYGGAVLTVVPITMACWVKPTATGVNYELIWLGQAGVTNQYWSLELRGNNSPNKVSAQTNSAGFVNAVTSTDYTAGVWHHACAVFATNASRAAYLNGGGKNTDTTSKTPASVDRTTLGAIDHSSPASYLRGALAEPAIWNVALTDAEVARLAQPGVLPTDIHPESLVWYPPVWGADSPEPDLMQRFSPALVGTGTPAKAAGPPVRPSIWLPASVIAPATTGATTYFGASSLTVTASVTTAGTPTKFAAAAQTVTASITTAGVPTKFASASLTETLTVTTAGVPTKFAASSLTETVAVTTVGTLGAFGAAATTITATITTAGSTAIFGAASLTITATATTTGTLGAKGASAQTVTASITTAGTPTKFAAASLTETLATTTAGTPTKFAASAQTVTITITTAGTGGAVTHTGAASSTFAFTVTTAGTRTAFGAASATVTVTATTAGEITFSYGGTDAFTYGGTAGFSYGGTTGFTYRGV